jgi:hypothetical protein
MSDIPRANDAPCRFYKGLRWFKKDAEPVVLIPGHNQHHRYTNPVIFDAFSGSLYDPLLPMRQLVLV